MKFGLATLSSFQFKFKINVGVDKSRQKVSNYRYVMASNISTFHSIVLQSSYFLSTWIDIKFSKYKYISDIFVVHHFLHVQTIESKNDSHSDHHLENSTKLEYILYTVDRKKSNYSPHLTSSTTVIESKKYIKI